MSTVLPGTRAPLLETLAGTDHKRIAVSVGVVAFTFFLAGGVLALLMRSELAEPGLQIVSLSTYNALFTMHGSTMIYLFVTPVALALGLYLVPLQVGASGLAGARCALAGLWLLVLGGLTMWSGFLVRGGAAAATWAGFDPLSNAVNSPGKAMDAWIWGVMLASLGELLMAGAILATLLGRRTAGMTMLRMPVFCWTQLITCLLVLFSFPVLIGAMTALWIDRQWGGVFTGPSAPVTYQHLFWFYGHPVVYVMFFPFLGAVAEVIAVFSGRRLFGYPGMVLSLLVFASLSMSVWAHHMLTIEGVAVKYFALTSTLLIVPAGMEYLTLLATLRGGRVRFEVPMLFALAFLIQFLVGGLTGIWVASPALDANANNSYEIVAHFHYTLLAGSVFGFFAGVYYWWPKVTGRLLGERLGRLQVALFAVGVNVTFAPQFALGEEGMTRRIADYPASEGWGTLNAVSTAGAFLVALSVLVFLVNAVVSRRVAGDDPWGGHTLEWATASPPPRDNFDGAPPPVRSFAPLLDEA
ncbi:MAG TPA: cbb3-type cytochrome c oxidase subunit I [Solirubrobacter sp.]|nr:cbb3-type cytochrome c oxidase subunit I [Solirubrobacter sp.]